MEEQEISDTSRIKTEKYLQHIFSEAPLPFSLVEEVVEVTAEGDENKAKSEEAKYAWQGETQQKIRNMIPHT